MLATMAETNVSSKYFQQLVEYPVAICKECRHGVWPDQVEGHLQKAHKVSRKEAESVGESVRRWAGLAQYPSELALPSSVVDPIGEIPQYADGLLCQLEPSRCRYVVRQINAMKKHWRKNHHQWSAGKKRGRPSRTRESVVQAQVEEGCRRVHCQRLFVQGHGSQYFEVRPAIEGQEAGPAPVPVDSEAAWARVGQAMAEAWDHVKQRETATIEDGEKDEVNPWLERTGWLPYLVGMERPDLLASIEEPNADPKKEEEPVEAAIWKAMDGLARHSQGSVIDRVGVFVRLEAIRTEKHQTRYQPLQPYMDEKSIVEHSRPWKQMLMFFARTQREHEWKSPQYRFTRPQREAWEALVQQARRGVAAETEEPMDDEMEGVVDDAVDEEVGEETDEEMDEEMDETMDRADEAEEEEEQDRAEQSTGCSNEPQGLSGTERACLRFCMALLDQSITRREYDSPLVCALAVLGVQEAGWKGPEQYPPILSAVIKVARFMVVQQALELSEPFREAEFDSDSAYESEESSSVHQPRRQGCLQWVQAMMDRFMVRGTHGPMQWMLDLRTYGLKVHYNTTSRGHVEWQGYDELLYKELHFNMAQFRSMVHGLTTETRRLLVEELLFCHGNGVPQVPWAALRDNPTDGRPGWNFLQDHRTRLPVDGERWLFDRVGQDRAIRDRFLKPASRSGVDRPGVERYMGRVVAFREKLAVLMHITGGQPARAPEVLSVRHSNTVKGGHRNVFVEDGMVVFVTRYHKGYAMSGDVKVIHRYVPREVGELVVWYLWLVLPFQQRLEAMVWEKEAISSHMWPKDPDGRQWTSERFRQALKRESSAGLGQALTIQAYREVAIGISRKFMRGSTAFMVDEGDDNEAWNEENAGASIADEQAGHTAHIAGLIYARGIMEQAGAVADKRQRFRTSSTDWHRFLGFQSAMDEDETCKKRKRAPFEREADEGRIDRWRRLRGMDAEAQLKRMMGQEAVFRGVQAPAIQAITAGESPVVAVMPTGGGKSLLFMLPAWAEQGGTTVVVVPLIALRGDMKRRCQQLGIPCAAWHGRNPPDAAAIVLVTPESAVSEGFMTFLNRLRATRQLDRIVIDECHVVLNRSYTFRKQMQRLGTLVAAEAPMVLLTATLPPSEEGELFQRMHFRRDQVKMFRASTARTNVAYRVVKADGTSRREEQEAMVLRMIQRKLRQWKTGKVVVYANTVGKVKQIAQEVGCHAYHHHAVGKASMLREFMEGEQRVIVATSALGMGVDIPDIRCIVHVDWPRTILDYAQESGRAGRDGLRSEALVVVGKEPEQQQDDGRTDEDQQWVRWYMEGGVGSGQCRRKVLDGYLDGRGDRVGCGAGEALCDVCGGVEEEGEEEEEEEGLAVRDEASSAGDTVEDVDRDKEATERAFRQQEQGRRAAQEEVVQARQREFMAVEWLQQQLERWAGRCGICEVMNPGHSSHDLRDCWRGASREAKAVVKMVEGEIRFEPYSGCFWCGVPQAICNRWESDERGRYRFVKAGSCQYAGVLVGGLVGMVFGYKEEVWERWRRRMAGLGVDLGSDEDLIGFLGKKSGLGAAESNHLAEEFCWIASLLVE